MSSEVTTCSGCDATFSLRGFHSHLAQTRDLLCLAVLNKLRKAHDADELSELSDNEDGNEEMVHMVAELDWEPHREGAPLDVVEDDQDGSGNVEMQPNSEEENGSDGEAARQHNIGRFIIGDGYGVKPTVRIRYTDKYPNARAGQPLSREETRDFGYASALGGDSPWAPFNSKKDWEVARWAKL